MNPSSVIKAPDSTTAPSNSFTVFLAGSIEMGKAVDWQAQIIKDITENTEGITLFSPRRDDWDSSWVQSKDNPQFSEQVNWELDRLEEVDLIVMQFCAGTMSPISLLELGLYTRSNKIIVHVDDEYERKGNVDITCAKYGVQIVDSIEDLIATIKVQKAIKQ